MADISSLEVVSEKIPHFWFDVIGRMVPGAFLLAGMLEMRSTPLLGIDVTTLLKQSGTALVIALLLSVAAAYLVGFLLGAVSYWVIEWTTDSCKPIKLENIPPRVRHFAEASLGQVDARRIRDFCGNFIWTHPEAVQIAVITSKRDAETLASRSVALAALCLAATNGCRGRWGHVLVLLLIFGAACLSFGHYHRRSFDTRFDATAALLRRTDEAAGSSQS